MVKLTVEKIAKLGKAPEYSVITSKKDEKLGPLYLAGICRENFIKKPRKSLILGVLCF